MSLVRRILRGKSASSVALLNLTSTAIVTGANFLTIPLFTRMLGVTGFGVIAVYTTWVQVAAVVIGLQAVGTLAPALASYPSEEIDSYQSNVLLLGLMSFALALGMAVLWLPALARLMKLDEVLVVLIVVQGFGMYLVNFFNMRFTLRKEAVKLLTLSVTVSVLTIAASLALIALVFSADRAYLGRALGLALPYAGVGAVLSLSLMAKALPRPRPSLAHWRFCLPLALPLILHGLSQIVLAQTDKVMLQQYISNDAAGIYSIAFTVSHLLTMLWLALNNAWVPFYYDDLRERRVDRMMTRFRNYNVLFTSVTVALIMVSAEVVKVLSTPDFWSGIVLIPPLAVGSYAMFMYSFPVNYEFYSKHTGAVALGTTGAALTNVALNMALIPRFGMLGACLATMGAYLALFLFHHVAVRYWYRYTDFPARLYAPGLLVVGGAAGLFYAFLDVPVARWAMATAALVFIGIRTLRIRTVF